MTKLTHEGDWYRSNNWDQILDSINEGVARLADKDTEHWDDLDEEFMGGFEALGLDWSWELADSEIREGTLEGWNFILTAVDKTGRIVYSGCVANYTPEVWTDDLDELNDRIRRVMGHAETWITNRRMHKRTAEILDSIELDRDPTTGERRTLGDLYNHREAGVQPHLFGGVTIPGRCARCGNRFDPIALVTAIKDTPFNYEAGVCPDCWAGQDGGSGLSEARRVWNYASWIINQARRNEELQEVYNA